VLCPEERMPASKDIPPAKSRSRRFIFIPINGLHYLLQIRESDNSFSFSRSSPSLISRYQTKELFIETPRTMAL